MKKNVTILLDGQEPVTTKGGNVRLNFWKVRLGFLYNTMVEMPRRDWKIFEKKVFQRNWPWSLKAWRAQEEEWMKKHPKRFLRKAPSGTKVYVPTTNKWARKQIRALFDHGAVDFRRDVSKSKEELIFIKL